jgi:hypothetical protein
MPSESVIESRKQGVDLSRTRGIGYGTANFIIGLSQFTKDPRYDSYVNFTVNPEVAAVSNSALDDDFSKHYGALSIYQVLQNFIDKGEMKDASKYRIGATKLQTAATPTNITRIETNLSQLAAAEWGPKLTFAKDDAEYRSLKAQALKAFTDAGLNEYNIWITKAWNDALDKAASYGM